MQLLKMTPITIYLPMEYYLVDTTDNQVSSGVS